MYIKVLLFGIASEIIKTEDNSMMIELEKTYSLKELKLFLKEKYNLSTINNFMIAVNESYENEDYLIKENDVLAIIPPVSGG